MTTLRTSTLALVFLVGCGSAEPTASTSAVVDGTQTSDDATTTSSSDARFVGAPEGTATIATLLLARHAGDLPDAAALARHPSPEASLVWLAEHGDPLIVRVRALASMRWFAGDAVRAEVLATLRDDTLHPTLRAAAATGSAGLTLDDELSAALQHANETGDPRIAHAVAERLAAIR